MDDEQHRGMGMGMSYGRFAAMIATSTVVMFGLMYVNVYAFGHIEFSQTRFWMAFVMGAAMALIMLGFMWSMYKNKTVNAAILMAASSCSRSRFGWSAVRRRWATCPT